MSESLLLTGCAGSNWRESSSWSDEIWVSRLVTMMVELQRVDIHDLARRVRLPAGDLAASPFGLRAVALAAKGGVVAAHRELDRVLDWPSSFGIEDPAHGTWDSGNLRVGKYQAFMQESPYATLDPAHVAKWGPHEMMHRACGFFWRSDASPFERYLGARLNELLPVALWYGADQVARLNQDEFVRHAAIRRVHVDQAAWLVEDEDALAARARRTLVHMRRFFAHLDTEFAAVDEEIRTRQCVITRHEVAGTTLNASSDAMAYVLAHSPRLDAMSGILSEAPAHPTIEAYRAHVESRVEALLFEDLVVNAVDGRAYKAWDRGMRAALGGDDEDCIANGLEGFDLGQLAEGLEQSAPVCFEYLEHDEGWLDAFVQSDAFRERGTLPERLMAHLSTSPDMVSAAQLAFEHAALEDLLLKAKPSPRERLLGGDRSRWMHNSGFRMRRFDYDVLAAHEGLEVVKPGGPILVGSSRSGTVALRLPDDVAKAWVSLTREGPCETEELLEGALGTAAPDSPMTWFVLLEELGALSPAG